MNSSDSKAREAFEAVREALPEFSQQDDYLLAHGASLMSEDSHEIVHVDTVRKIVAAALQWAASQQAPSNWTSEYAEIIGRIQQPYTLAELREKIDNNEYGAEHLLQHAMRLLAASQQAAEGEPLTVGAWRHIHPDTICDLIEKHRAYCSKDTETFRDKALHQLLRDVVDAAAMATSRQLERVRIYDYVWPQRERDKENCTYTCNYSPAQHLAKGELLAVVHPSQILGGYLQRDAALAHPTAHGHKDDERRARFEQQASDGGSMPGAIEKGPDGEYINDITRQNWKQLQACWKALDAAPPSTQGGADEQR